MNYSEKLTKLYDTTLSWACYVTKNKELAEDITHDVFFRFLEKEDVYGDIKEKSLKLLLMASVKNQFITYLRKQKLQEKFLLLEENECADSKVMVSEIISGVTSLPKHYRDVISKRMMGYDYNSICKELNIPMGTLKSRIHFGRKLLKTKI